MADVLFYHMERAPLEAVLPDLLEKSMTRGWRVTVRFADKMLVEKFDEHLWTYADDSFLPHSANREAGASSEEKIWLTDTQELSAKCDVLFVIDDAAVDPEEIDGLERAVFMFDGRRDDVVELAREQWRAVKSKKLDATYWRQDDEGRWRKQ